MNRILHNSINSVRRIQGSFRSDSGVQLISRFGVQLSMKIKAFSWVLAGAFLLCGVIFFRVIPQFEFIFTGFSIPLPPATRCVFAVGRFGWLSVAVIAGALVIFKDLWFRSRLSNWMFMMLLSLLAGYVTLALLLPALGPNMTHISAN
jgi:hypothetical protein